MSVRAGNHNGSVMHRLSSRPVLRALFLALLVALLPLRAFAADWMAVRMAFDASQGAPETASRHHGADHATLPSPSSQVAGSSGSADHSGTMMADCMGHHGDHSAPDGAVDEQGAHGSHCSQCQACGVTAMPMPETDRWGPGLGLQQPDTIITQYDSVASRLQLEPPIV